MLCQYVSSFLLVRFVARKGTEDVQLLQSQFQRNNLQRKRCQCARVTLFVRKRGRTSGCFVNVLFMARSNISIRSYGRMPLSRKFHVHAHARTCTLVSLERVMASFIPNDLLKRFKQFQIFNKLFKKVLFYKIYYLYILLINIQTIQFASSLLSPFLLLEFNSTLNCNT